MSTTRPQPLPHAGGPGQPSTDLRVGGYRLLAKIGEGGMGVVHLAQAPDGRRVALKVLRPHIIGDDEARERLSREVASLRRVRSARVAEILDADPWGPTPFVATRYVPGLSLHEHAQQEGPIRGEDLRYFAAGLAEALHAVHSVRVLHRDIKPSNVLLEGRSPVLIDFGLARLAEDPRMTVTGWLLGTPGYLAPEILYGEDATVSSDVHSWAATLVFAATGRPPFGRGPAMAIMDRVRRGEHDLADVPAELLPLVRSCLAADPAARPSLTAVLDRLERPAVAESPRPTSADDFTMPFAVAAAAERGPDTDATAVVEATQDASAEARTLVRPAVEMALPTLVQPPVHQPARAPYMQPSPPRPDARPRGDSGVARNQRGTMLLGLFLLVAVGFAAAPYLALTVLGLVALAVRTASWTSDSVRNRQYRRGRRRWYDGALAAASSPWYLLVATGGTIMLMAWAATLSFLVGLGLLLFRSSTEPGLLLMGAVLALTLWWGPGARRLRGPTRSLLARASRSPWVGWAAVGSVALGVVLVGYLLVTHGVSWDPQPGPPWRSGTLLGGMAGFL